VAGTMLTIFSPAVTLIIYAIQAEIRGAKSVDVNMAFTSLAIIGMVTSPANAILVMIAHAASSIASWDRIQKYLTSPDREDKREILEKYTSRSSRHLNSKKPSYSFDSSRKYSEPNDGRDLDNIAIVIDGATIRPAFTADPVLLDIKSVMKQGTLIILSGAVGTGKTTLAKALLGDLLLDSGKIKTAYGSIAYCSQTTWLTNETIKSSIQGPVANDSEVNQEWYKRVLRACDLDEDLHQFPDSDQTLIGSRGINLSGGQKHRVVRLLLCQMHDTLP